MLNGLDLFSGYGGITKALRKWVMPVAYCEIERYTEGILLSRMSEGELPQAPIWDDIRTLKANMLPDIDILYGGFPCQDISVAGAGKGLSGERSGLIREVFRLLDETKAPFVFLENVPAIRTRGAETISKELAKRGYDCRWCMLSASDVGARHKRERWFLLAHSTGLRRNERSSEEVQQKRETIEYEKSSDARSQRGEQRSTWWTVEPDMGRVADGRPFRVDRIKALGNGVVPPQVKKAFEILMFGE